jgi:hypothetical protein
MGIDAENDAGGSARLLSGDRNFEVMDGGSTMKRIAVRMLVLCGVLMSGVAVAQPLPGLVEKSGCHALLVELFMGRNA